MATVSRALSKLGNDVVARMAQEAVRGASVVRLQFLASEFYEAVKAELDQTPRHEADRDGTLAAAADQCRRSAENCTSPQLMLVEIRAAVSVLCNGRYQKLAAEPKPVTVVLPFPSDHKQPRERSRLANHSSFLRCSPARATQRFGRF